MRKLIPKNNVTINYNLVLDSYIELITQKQKKNIKSIFLTGSYARGDATDASDLDVWCVFDYINSKVLSDVGNTVKALPISYSQVEVNTQSLSMEEINSDYFSSWIEKPVKILDGVLLYGEDLFDEMPSLSNLNIIYKRYLADVLMSIRHYICVEEAVDKLTYKKMKTYIFKPLMFALRIERYCSTSQYPVSNIDLLNSYDNELYVLVEYFLNKEKLEKDISINHSEFLFKIHDLVSKLLS